MIHAPVAHNVAHLDQLEELPYRDCRLRPVRHHFGITAFGVTAWTANAAGERLIPEHEESDENSPEELYVVVQGHSAFELDGERLDAPAGTLVFVRPGVNRAAFAEEPGTSILALGATPGRAYVPDGWEIWEAHYDAGEYAEAADRAREVIEAHPEWATQPPYAALFYNVACIESLAGRRAEAVEHLRLALDMSEDFRELAKRDSDLDSIRGEPGFPKLVGSEA
jgi:tetratricopeptide (TPR) repeat protein